VASEYRAAAQAGQAGGCVAGVKPPPFAGVQFSFNSKQTTGNAQITGVSKSWLRDLGALPNNFTIGSISFHIEMPLA
jgi:hypothetical protein